MHFQCLQHAIQDGPKIKLQTLVNISTLILRDFTDSISVMPSEQFSMKIYDKSHHT